MRIATNRNALHRESRVRAIAIKSGHDAGHMCEIKLAPDRCFEDLPDFYSSLGHFLVRVTVLLQCGDTVVVFGTAELGEEKAGMDAADVHHCRVKSLWSKGLQRGRGGYEISIGMTLIHRCLRAMGE